jgi:hypothetical protein
VSEKDEAAAGYRGLAECGGYSGICSCCTRQLEIFCDFHLRRVSDMEFQDQFRLVGENVAKVRMDVMKEQLATFRSQLEEFARKHKVIRCYLVLVEYMESASCYKKKGSHDHDIALV